MRQVLDDTLSLGAKNAVVHAFKKLVYNSLGKDFKSEDKNATSNTTIPPRYVAELDKDLYNKAVSLPEALTVSLDKTSNVDKYQYGIFAGGTVYKTLDGDIDENNKDVRKQEGWLILDRSSTEYALFVADSGTYIIAISSFTPTPIVKDFKPLYDKLSETKHTNTVTEDSVKPDTRFLESLAVTFRDDISDIVTSYTELEYSNTVTQSSSSSGSGSTSKFDFTLPMLSVVSADLRVKIYQAWLLYMQASMLWGDAVFLAMALKDRLDHLMGLNWLARKDKPADKLDIDELKWGAASDYAGNLEPVENPFGDAKRDTLYDDIQAIVYVLGKDLDATSPCDMLYSFQNPDEISYTTQAQYDAVQTRGTQQPLQYYNQANQVDLSFTLRWHADEARSMLKSDGSAYSLQDIAEVAESFTRPWDADGGNKGKLCMVVLPSIARIGYINSVNIKYDGDMIGSSVSVVAYDNVSEDYIANVDDDFYNGKSTNGKTEYGFNMLTITFGMLIVQDVTLQSEDANKGKVKLSLAKTSDRKRSLAKEYFSVAREDSEEGAADTSMSGILNTVGNALSNSLEIAETTVAIADAALRIGQAEANMVSAATEYFSSF